MILLSVKAGLRACEIALLDWSMVLDARGRIAGLMGDGVNIAARLEGVALRGVVCLSEDPNRKVRSQPSLEIRDLGEKQLKNISRCASIRSWSAS